MSNIEFDRDGQKFCIPWTWTKKQRNKEQLNKGTVEHREQGNKGNQGKEANRRKMGNRGGGGKG